ncbi:MAG: lipid-A-disaccharide synthase [Thermoguttaceae bacterium]
MPRIFISVGEPSGDAHGAELIKRLHSLNADVECVGLGGPKMHAAGCALIDETTSQAIMGFSRVLTRYAMLRRRLDMACDALKHLSIACVVLIDFPGFNWHVAAAAKRLGIPVVYFMPPQIWAWASWRAKKMQRLIDHVLTPLEFEHRWFEHRGITTTFIGHPFLESMRSASWDQTFLDKVFRETTAPILTILPGSRDQEVHANGPVMVRTIERVIAEVPVSPVVAAFSQSQADHFTQLCQQRHLDIPIYVGKSTELIRAADVALSVSGSVSMELLAANVPSVIVYRVGWTALQFQRWFRNSRYITLVNLLQAAMNGDSLFFKHFPIPTEPTDAERDAMAMPEFLSSRDHSDKMAATLTSWLGDTSLLAKRKQLLTQILEYADPIPSPTTHAAELILAKCKQLENHQ